MALYWLIYDAHVLRPNGTMQSLDLEKIQPTEDEDDIHKKKGLLSYQEIFRKLQNSVVLSLNQEMQDFLIPRCMGIGNITALGNSLIFPGIYPVRDHDHNSQVSHVYRIYHVSAGNIS